MSTLRREMLEIPARRSGAAGPAEDVDAIDELLERMSDAAIRELARLHAGFRTL